MNCMKYASIFLLIIFRILYLCARLKFAIKSPAMLNRQLIRRSRAVPMSMHAPKLIRAAYETEYVYVGITMRKINSSIIVEASDAPRRADWQPNWGFWLSGPMPEQATDRPNDRPSDRPNFDCVHKNIGVIFDEEYGTTLDTP